MKRIDFSVIFVIVVLIGGFYVYALNKSLSEENQQLTQLIEIGIEKNQELLNEREMNRFYLNAHLESELTHIDLNEIVIRDSANRQFSLSEFLAHESILFFRLSQSECADCNHKMLRVISEVYRNSLHQKNQLKVAVLASYSDPSLFYDFYDILDVPVFFSNDFTLPLPFEQTGHSYFFELSDGGIVSDAYYFPVEDLNNAHSYIEKRFVNNDIDNP